MNREKQPAKGDNSTYIFLTEQNVYNCSSDMPFKFGLILWLPHSNLSDNVHLMERKGRHLLHVSLLFIAESKSEA